MRLKLDCTCLRLCAAFLLFFFLSFSAIAQKSVTGTIINSKDNSPIGYATVTVKGTNVAVVSDADGSFSINLPADKTTLVISSVGFATIEAEAGTGPVSIRLTETSSNLDEIVVTGYTAQKKKDITGAVAVVDVKNLKAIPGGNPDQMLQGQAAGVQVITNGQPGANSQINIRGITSFGNNDPLYIVDGVQSGFHDINPNDIESIQVLKDAGSAAIYGVQGSNGVIVITTKKGKGRSSIGYDGFVGVQVPLSGNPLNLLNAQEMMQLAQKVGDRTAFYGTDYKIPEYVYRDQVTGVNGTGSAGDPAVDPSKYRFDPAHQADYFIAKTNPGGTDWFHEVFKPALQQSHTVTASGANEKSAYMFSFNYLNQQGTVINTYLKRYSVRVNTTTTVKNTVRVGENAYLFYKDNPQIPNLWENSIVAGIYGADPVMPVHDIAGNYAGAYHNASLANANNPVAGQERAGTNKRNTWAITGNVFAEVDFLRHFTARTSFGGTVENQYYYNFGFTPYESFENHNLENSFTEGAQYASTWLWTNTLAYSNVFAEKHSLKVLIGSEAKETYARGVEGARNNYSPTLAGDPNFWTLNNGTSQIVNQTFGYFPGGAVYSTSIYSLFARLDYAFGSKYLVGATFRRDGASVLAPDVRYGNFPSVSLGWRVSEENFMKDISWINDLKLRGSWGKLGSVLNVDPANAAFTYGQSTQSSFYDINGTSNSSVPGYLQTQVGNANTSWEKDKITNIGLDASLFKNKLDFTAEYFIKAVDGLLFQYSFPAAGVGFATYPVVNGADIENKGFELNATYHATTSKELKFDIGLNFTHYNNKIVQVPNPGYFDVAASRQGQLVRNMPGSPVGAFFGYEVIGIFQDADEVAKSPVQPDAAAGRFIFRDVDGNDTINAADRKVIGNPNPDFTYGLNLGVTYKNWTFSAFFYGSQGNDDYNEVRYWTDFYGSFPMTKSKDALYNSWTPDNPNAKLPVLELSGNQSTINSANSYFVEDGSFFKCRYVKIAYNFSNSAFLKRIGVNNFSAYVQALNLFTITSYGGMDPELQSAGSANGANPGYAANASFGIDYGNYPNNQQTYLIGFSLNF